MPALQVRDFPEELYQSLKTSAARHHRSVAQQTIVAVEEMVRRESGGCQTSEPTSLRLFDADTSFDFEANRCARSEKRRDILARAAHRREILPSDLPAPLDLLSCARRERDTDFDRLMNKTPQAPSSEGGARA